MLKYLNQLISIREMLERDNLETYGTAIEEARAEGAEVTDDGYVIADKFEWLERQIEHLMEEFFSFRDLLDADSGFAWVFRHFDEHFESYSILFSDRTGLSFQNRFTEWLSNHLRAQTEKDPASAETEFEIQYLAAAISGMLRWWVLNSRPLPPERMAQRMLELYRGFLRQM